MVFMRSSKRSTCKQLLCAFGGYSRKSPSGSSAKAGGVAIPSPSPSHGRRDGLIGSALVAVYDQAISDCFQDRRQLTFFQPCPDIEQLARGIAVVTAD